MKDLEIFPPNGSAIDDRKLLPSKVYDKTIENPGQSDQTPNNKNLALIALEEEMDRDVIEKFQTRLSEGYDLGNDPLYNTWKKLKDKSRLLPAIRDITNTQQLLLTEKEAAQPKPSSMIKEMLHMPNETVKKPSRAVRGTACLPKHLSGEDVIKFLEERKTKQQEEERQKVERQKLREIRKIQKKEEEKIKEGRRKMRELQRKEKNEMKQTAQAKKAAAKKTKKDDNECKCAGCDEAYEEFGDSETTWIECESCFKWYHLKCTLLPIDTNLEDINYICDFCM